MFRTMVMWTTVFLATAISLPASSAADQISRAPETSVALQFLAALGHLEFDAAASFLDENAILELPYAGDGLTISGRENILQFLAKTMSGSVTRLEYKLERAYPSPEAGATVLELSTQGLTSGGRKYTNRLIGIFEFRDGKIVLFREYFNPNRIN